MKQIKVFEAFAGVGCQRQALKNANIPHSSVGISEIDKYAIKSYEALHGKVNNYGDISKIEPSELPDFDLFTYSFPCQDISNSGYRLGFEKGSNTRSSLLWECEKIIKEKRPKYLLMENVKNLVSKNFLPYYEKWLKLLEDMGYTNYWQVLNSRDYGLPQNRERVFCVSIRGEHKPFKFPKKEELNISIKDFLSEEVDEKYYLNETQVYKIINNSYCSSRRRIQNKQWCDTLCARDFKGPKCVEVVKNGEKRVRKLTPEEYWLLMGFTKEQFNLMAKNSLNSDSQLYKQAGNGITLNILGYLFQNMFLNQKRSDKKYE